MKPECSNSRIDRTGDTFSRGLGIAATAVPVLFTLVFIFRPDSLAAVTIWPAWFWLAGGLAVLLVFCRILPRRLLLAALAFWLVFTAVCCDEPRGLLRFGQLLDYDAASRHSAGYVRVVTLNCGGGSKEALQEVIEYQPDVVLVQESPGSKEISDVKNQLYGSLGTAVYGLDASVICRYSGNLVSKDINGTVVDIELYPGAFVRVASVRLPTPSTRADLWNPDCWREYTSLRRTQGELLHKYRQILEQSKASCLIGGDFNLPAGDGALSALRPAMKDAYDEAGAGLCNTIINDIPMHRIDQLWMSRDMKPEVMRVFQTVNSDHRMVVCDIKVR